MQAWSFGGKASGRDESFPDQSADFETANYETPGKRQLATINGTPGRFSKFVMNDHQTPQNNKLIYKSIDKPLKLYTN